MIFRPASVMEVGLFKYYNSKSQIIGLVFPYLTFFL